MQNIMIQNPSFQKCGIVPGFCKSGHIHSMGQDSKDWFGKAVNKLWLACIVLCGTEAIITACYWTFASQGLCLSSNNEVQYSLTNCQIKE